VTGDVFRRLALIACCSGWAVGVSCVWVYLGWPAGLFALVAGPGGAFVLSLESAPAVLASTASVDVVEEPAGLSRREIEKRARQAREDDDD
jgi:hypothetical protein